MVLFLSTILLNASCDYVLKDASKNTSQLRISANDTVPKIKTITEIFYTDKGAVVPRPTVTTVHFIFKDSLNAFLTYKAVNLTDTLKNEAKISPDRIAFLRDLTDALADVEDGEELKQGKNPCVGTRSVDVNIVYNTSDTTRFRISGGARCDATILPAWHQMDSLAQVLNQENRTPPQY
ncbi:MAG: hypothetical protein HC817_03845 [Saprospiraceae bacterium]|nr:hypothetical protein [Saprospiraceae bacterium]